MQSPPFPSAGAMVRRRLFRSGCPSPEYGPRRRAGLLELRVDDLHLEAQQALGITAEDHLALCIRDTLMFHHHVDGSLI